MTLRTDQATLREWLVGGGELGELIRLKDWSSTPLGPRERWPQSLRTAVCLLVESKLPLALLWGPELLLVYNDACRAIIADKHPATLGRSAREVWHVDEPSFSAVMERGETLYFTLCYSPVRLEDGTVGGTLVTLQEAPAARARAAPPGPSGQTDPLDAAVRSAEMGLWSWDPVADAIEWDAPMHAIFGVPLGQGPRTFAEYGARLGPDERGPFMRKVDTPDSLPQSDTVRRTIVRPDGARRSILVRSRTLRDAAGRVTKVVGASFDVTEYELVRERLRETEERFRLVFEQSPVGIALTSLDYRFLKVNDALCRITGYDAAELEGMPFGSITHPDDVGDNVAQARRLAASEIHLYDTEKRYVRKDGSVVWVHLLARLLQDAAGLPVCFVSMMDDISDRKRAERVQREASARLEEADRRKNEFLAVLSHELRNPLAPIRNSLYILDRAPKGGEQARRAQAIIERQIKHLTRLVDDLLDVSRITRGKVVLQRERLDLCELVRRAVEDHRGAFVEGEIDLELSTGPGEVWVNGDQTRLSQAVGNLLQNAAKFTPREGKTTVTVRADTAHGEAIIRVQDTGRGIAPDLLPRLFEAFTQADATLDRKKGGLGLGLSLVKGLVEMHGGSASVASEGPGKGATFTISLPLKTSAPLIETGRGAAEVHAPSCRVLVIEDNVDAAESLREALRLGGHEVEVAFSGPEGIQKARALRPDVVLCDIGLPDMDGYQVARAMRDDPRLASVRLVALTGYAGLDDVAKAKEAGFDAHLAKPPSMDAIERALEDPDPLTCGAPSPS